MRPVLALVVVGAILGSVQAYMMFQASLPAPTAVQPILSDASGDFMVEVTLTFDAAADEFSALEPFSLLVSLHGAELLRRSDEIRAGEPVRVEPVRDVHHGPNEFYVSAIPRDEASSAMRAARIRVFRNGEVVAEQTLWSEPGLAVEGKIAVDVAVLTSESDEHDH